ncbi:hypothetical protein JHK85_010667 [Glycine max]|nr:hypothetical protein JHK85_010667 [Glycine max]
MAMVTHKLVMASQFVKGAQAIFQLLTGLAAEKGDIARGTDFTATLPLPHTTAIDFRQTSKMTFLFIIKHNLLCARFSADGRFVATGSADTSIKLFEVSKIKQMLLPEAKDGPVRPIIRTYYDHIQAQKVACAPLDDLSNAYSVAIKGGNPIIAIFNETEEFILSIDELSNEIVIWDAITTEKVAKWPSNHVGAPRWLEHSPIESAFISCGTDRSVRFWK